VAGALRIGSGCDHGVGMGWDEESKALRCACSRELLIVMTPLAKCGAALACGSE
jgi:hypothetical protein